MSHVISSAACGKMPRPLIPSCRSFLSSAHLCAAQTHFLLERARSRLMLLRQLLLCQEVLKELIHRPGDGGGGHLVYNSSLDPFEEGWQTTELVHRPESVRHTGQVTADVHGAERYVLLCVEQCFADIERSSNCCGNGSCCCAWQYVATGVVMSVRV